jgi:ribosomal protein S18 acetylase RimI-like enzyme
VTRVLAVPRIEQVLAFCAEDPVERVFLEDVARRGLGRFVAVERADGALASLCHTGANVVPAGEGCGAFGPAAGRARARMIIGDQRAVDELWATAQGFFPEPRDDRPGQPVYVLREAPQPGETGIRAAQPGDLAMLVPACAAAYLEELGVDPLANDPDGFRWRTRVQIEEGRSWLWEEGGRILFKAEASAWTPHAVQLQQVWADAETRGHGFARRGLQDLCRLLLGGTPAVCLFVRPENERAIRLYDAIGMQREGVFRTLVF